MNESQKRISNIGNRIERVMQKRGVSFPEAVRIICGGARNMTPITLALLGKQFRELVEIEPRLGELEQTILRHATLHIGDSNYCASEHWYFPGPLGFKEAMSSLVGWDASKPLLATESAYSIAYDYLYHLLPDCGHKGMCRW